MELQTPSLRPERCRDTQLGATAHSDRGTDGERVRAGQGAQTRSCLLVMKDQKTDGKTLQHAFFGTKTSDNLKKLFSKPSLSSVLKGGVDSG